MILHLLLAASAAFAKPGPFKDYTTPTKRLPLTEYPRFVDDYDLTDMETAIQRQLVRFKTKDLRGKIELGGKNYPLTLAKESLIVFLQLVQNFKVCTGSALKSACYDNLNNEIRARFDVFAPDLKPGDERFGEANDSFFTGYHTHPIIAKSKPDAKYKYAIYKKPRGQDQFKTREQIDFLGGLKKKSLDIAYTDNLFDLYLLHVEGGGFVTIEEKGRRENFYLSYDATNNQRWAWISKHMKDKGYIDNTSIAAQRKFLRLNPVKHREVYATNPSYIYFTRTTHEPVGSDTVPVTSGRTLATDRNLYGFKGLLAYVEGERPAENGNYDFEEENFTNIPFQPFSRFFLDQDTGGAIKGKGRADIYFGKTTYSYYAATYQQKTGNLRFLMLKDPAP